MDRSIILAADLSEDAATLLRILSTSEGQRGFWTADCDVDAEHARFGFPQAPVDLITDVSTEAGKLVRMHVTAGFPFWDGSTWEWELGPANRAESGTAVVFRHYGFGAGYSETDLAYT
ncbi:MAG: hypothetical protein ACRDVG_16725, partial [Jatrophihabitantaceae bacterium]